MRVRIHGTRVLDFVSNGEPIQGVQVFFSHPADGVVGEKTDKVFLRKGFPIPPELAPGVVADIFCDTKGHVEHIQIAASK